jgi:parallel beta-helix repeat protein
VLQIASSIRSQPSGEINYYNEIYIENNIGTSDYPVTTPIIIDDSDPNYNWSKTALENDWCSGLGTWANPYIVQDITSNSTIKVQHSNVHFKIMNCVSVGINIYDVENGIIVDNQIYGGWGLDLVSCNLTVVSGMLFNDTDGIYIRHSRDLFITANTFNSVDFGIDAWNCNFSEISSNEFNYCGGTCIEFTNLNIHNQILNNLINNSADYGMDFNGNDNTISNNVISNNKDGLIISGINNLIFNNTIVDNEECGILNHGWFTNYGNEFVENKVINNGGYGVSTANSDGYFNNNVSLNFLGFYGHLDFNVHLKENIISNNRKSGIELAQCNNFNITDNLMYGCGFLVIDSGWDDDVELLSHNISLNLVNDRNLYLYYNQTGLRSNNFTDAGQIILWYCNDSIIRGQDLSHASRGLTSLYGKNISIINNDLSGNSISGIYIDGGSEFNISGNLLSFSKYGIEAHGLESSSITNNTANECSYGIYLGSLDNSSISHNTMNNNVEDGLYLWGGYSSTISYNVANNNGDAGFTLDGSNNNNFFENEANYNDYGLFLTNSYNNTITRNTFLENRIDCIHGAEGNNVFDNICIDYTGLFYQRIYIWMMFGLAIAGSTIGLIVSILKVIKKRKRQLKLERI